MKTTPDTTGIKVGYDPTSPEGDKTRFVIRFPDGELKYFVPEDWHHQQLQKAREEILEEMLQSTIVAPDLFTLKKWIREEQKKYQSELNQDTPKSRGL